MVAPSPSAAVPPPLRIVFFGTPQFAVPTLRTLIESRHTVCGVVSQPDRRSGRGHKVSDSPVKALALEHHLPVFQPERLREPQVAETISAWRPDLGVVAAYGKLIPEAMLTLPPLGMINVHASLLPRLRGAAPVHRAVIDGDLETGVTIMRVEKNLDAGDMFAKARRPIAGDETSDVVERDLAVLGARLLLEVVEQMAAGTARAEPQDYMFATFAPKVTKEDAMIDWSLPASFVHNRVRGLYPWPHAHTYLEGRRLILLRTRVESEQCDAAPGTVIAVSAAGIKVATGHAGCLTILELQPEGRRAMTVADFLAGHPVNAGTVLGRT